VFRFVCNRISGLRIFKSQAFVNANKQVRFLNMGRRSGDQAGPAIVPAAAQGKVVEPQTAHALPVEDSPAAEAMRLQHSLRVNDGQVFKEVYQRYSASMSRVAAAYVGRNSALVDEVVHDTWMAVIQGIQRFEHRAGFRTWLFSILANRARSTAKREHRTMPFSALTFDDEAQGVENFLHSRAEQAGSDQRADETAEDQALRLEDGLDVMEALSQLPEHYQALLTLRDVEDVPAKDACELLGLSPENQRVLLFRARNKLREILLQARLRH